MQSTDTGDDASRYPRLREDPVECLDGRLTLPGAEEKFRQVQQRRRPSRCDCETAISFARRRPGVWSGIWICP